MKRAPKSNKEIDPVQITPPQKQVKNVTPVHITPPPKSAPPKSSQVDVLTTSKKEGAFISPSDPKPQESEIETIEREFLRAANATTVNQEEQKVILPVEVLEDVRPALTFIRHAGENEVQRNAVSRFICLRVAKGLISFEVLKKVVRRTFLCAGTEFPSSLIFLIKVNNETSSIIAKNYPSPNSSSIRI